MRDARAGHGEARRARAAGLALTALLGGAGCGGDAPATTGAGATGAGAHGGAATTTSAHGGAGGAASTTAAHGGAGGAASTTAAHGGAGGAASTTAAHGGAGGADTDPCGDGACAGGETCADCPADCGGCGACGDGACAGGETCATCRRDCGRCDEADVKGKCAFDPTMGGWPGGGGRDITFVAAADVHFTVDAPGCKKNAIDVYGTGNVALRDAINSAAAHAWPKGFGFVRAGQPFDHLRGAVLVGDLTDAGSDSVPAGIAHCPEYSAMRAAYGRCGTEGKLVVPTYTGYGNHDVPMWPSPGTPDDHPVIDWLDALTAADRPGAAADLYDDPTPGTAHYAWRWNDVWFVNLDLKPGFVVELAVKNGTTRLIDPHDSTAFLKAFLLSRSKSTTRQIVIMAHYPIEIGRIEDAERTRFCSILRQAQTGAGDFGGSPRLAPKWPVMAYLHGHMHDAPHRHDYDCEAVPITIPELSVGAPLSGPKSKHPGTIQFSMIRIGKEALEFVGVEADAADPTGPWTYSAAERITQVLPP